MRRIAEALPELSTANTADVVVRKRALVERYLRDAVLGRTVRESILKLHSRAHVAILSRGLVASMRSIVDRSVPDAANDVRIYGRNSLDERVNKEDLLRRAMHDVGSPARSTVYVGDADVDRHIAAVIGVKFRFASCRDHGTPAMGDRL
jgi:phosphoglycolate phosphatase-like HAD superfamily hydrolase